MSRHITIVQSDDWEGMYVDGSLAYQGHSIDSGKMLQLLIEHGLILPGVKLSYEAAIEPVFIENDRRLPSNLQGVVKWVQGKHAVEHPNGEVSIYVDGELEVTVDKKTYNLIKETTS